MNTKYEITDIAHEKYPFLHRIRALRDIGSEVKAGDLGGFENMGKSIGKDGNEGKYTAVSLYGLSDSKLRADLYTDRCIKMLEALDGDTKFLKDTVYFVRQRIN